MIVLVLSKHYERVLNMNQRVLQLKEISCSVVWWYGTVLTVKFAAFWWYIISLKCILQRTRLKKENSVKVDYNIVHMLNLYMYKYSTNLYIFILMSKSTCVFFFFSCKTKCHMCKRQLEPIQPISLCHFIQWFRWNWIIPDGDSVFPLMSSSCSAWTLCGLKVFWWRGSLTQCWDRTHSPGPAAASLTSGNPAPRWFTESSCCLTVTTWKVYSCSGRERSY